MMEMFDSSWRQHWKEWELRGLVILSLTAQIILVALGKRRKYIAGTWIRWIVWGTYLLADYIAAMAIGILSNDLGEVNKRNGFLDAKYELRGFWGPLLLVHLGGTDAITAYSLEDNELWKRHLFGVVSQAVVTAYILLKAWTSSFLSVLSILMFIVGIAKYSERVRVLYLASEKKFRKFTPNFIDGSKITVECKLKEVEGYRLTHLVLEVDNSANRASYKHIPDADLFLTANSMLEMVKRLFADVVIGFNDRDRSKAIFEDTDMSADKAFKIIELELSLIYDLLYTKAKVVYSFFGIGERIFGILFTIGVLVTFLTIDEKLRHSKIDYYVTLALFVGAFFLELWAFAELLLSDQTAYYLILQQIKKRTDILQQIEKRTDILQQIAGLSSVSKKRRWSNSISLLTFSPEEKSCLHQILQMLHIDEMYEIYQYETPVPLSGDLKEFIFKEIKKVRSHAEGNVNATDLKALFGRRGGRTLSSHDREDLDWSVKLGFDQSILIWHLATVIYDQLGGANVEGSQWKISKCLSQYMLYLLVDHPYMLRIEIGHTTFHDIRAGVRNFIRSITREKITTVIPSIRGGGNMVIVSACNIASALLPEEGMNKTKEDSERYKSTQKKNWDMIVNVWLEMLGYAASQCGGTHHAGQLRNGGELLTHVWLLMAHLGLTDHFQIEHSPTIAAAVVV